MNVIVSLVLPLALVLKKAQKERKNTKTTKSFRIHIRIVVARTDNPTVVGLAGRPVWLRRLQICDCTSFLESVCKGNKYFK